MSKALSPVRPADTLTQKEGVSNIAAITPGPKEAEEDRLENHPLWPALLEEIAANRRADIEREISKPAE